MVRPAQVDSAVVRGKAAFHCLLPAAGFLLDTVASPAGKVLVAFTALAMTVSVLGGPQVSLFGLAYTRVLRPVFGLKPGHREAAPPHRFAETVGAVFLSVATLCFLLGVAPVGWALVVVVVALAAINWLAGICVGCMMYPLVARLGPGHRPA